MLRPGLCAGLFVVYCFVCRAVGGDAAVPGVRGLRAGLRAGSRDVILTKLRCLLCLDPFVHRVDAFREIRKTHFDPYVGCDRVGLFVRTPEIFGRIGDRQLRSRELKTPYLAEVVGLAGGLLADYDRIGQVLEIHRIQDGRGECASPDDDIGFYAGMLFQEPGQPFDECRPLCRIPSAVVPHVENDLPDGVALQYAERLLAELRKRRQRRGFLAALELRLAFTPPAGVVEAIVYFFLGEIAILAGAGLNKCNVLIY